MATEKLFGNHITPACKYCEEVFQQSGTQIFCVKKGIVAPDYSCNKFIYDPLKRVPERRMDVGGFQNEDFSIT